jgi:peptidoglycan/xylan/chitin deacetylase (PgdA/CDA1 family)
MLARRAAYRALQVSGYLAYHRARRVSSGGGWATILVFHRVTDQAPEDAITLAPARFASMLRVLRRAYRVISATELVSALRHRRPFSGREVVISFDDGYLDNYDTAAPLLRDQGLPAVFFLTAGYVGTAQRFPWDVEKGIDGPLMSWSQAAELVRHGFEVGCHTWSHADLGREPIASWNRELLDARRFMEDRLGAAVPHFAYPFGGRQHIRPEWVEAARRAGFSSLFCGFGGAVTIQDDPYWIPRLGAGHHRSPSELRIDLDQAW